MQRTERLLIYKRGGGSARDTPGVSLLRVPLATLQKGRRALSGENNSAPFGRYIDPRLIKDSEIKRGVSGDALKIVIV